MRFGDEVKKKRCVHNLSQAAAGELAGLDQSEICRLEQGRTNPKVDTFIKLVNLFDLDADISHYTLYNGPYWRLDMNELYEKTVHNMILKSEQKVQLGTALKRARVAKGWSVRDVSISTGLAHSTISKTENNISYPVINTALILCLALGISTDLSSYIINPDGACR